MKVAIHSLSRSLRLGITAGALLLAQQALALGTDAGVTVSNQATVAYTVGTAAQTPIESSPTGNATPGAGAPTTFLVDRRVDFTLVETSGGPTTPVAPGDADVIASFTLTNNGNAIMDFDLAVADFAGAVFGNADTTDLGNYRIRVANGDGAGGVPDLGTDLDFVDELAEDAVVEIYVFADAPLTVSNGDYANIQLTATAADDADAVATPGTLDAVLAESPGVDDPAVIESVFADTDNNGFEQAEDSYEIISAALEITKVATVFSDPFGSGKALPGAVVEYIVTIDNTTGAADATGITLTDLIQIADVVLQNGVYNAGASNISFNAGASFCNADDAVDTDADGCSYDIGTGALSITVPDVTAGTSTTVRFQVLIPNT
ncbi:MAG: hypothetical protein OEW64_04370 [Gammaproteobacteria bacterium]|nr:hypothetical protein [Gammaproteobacteria bacterium]MDH5303314.1 hypothetical protein [Gammaproteobacteria bacterium]MDH5321603.1 hypothetical protein [Gammaproteobacteria bacterium]